MFSVIIPLYNKGNLVRRAIDSVLSQSLSDFEVIVVDDGSTDDSAYYVKGYADSRIRYYYKTNGGVSAARNYGIRQATGEWILFLDADDELAAGAMQTFASMIGQYPEVSICVGGIRDSGPDIRQCVASSPYYRMWQRRFYPCPRNMVIRRDRVGMFDERQSFFEDEEFSLRVMKGQSVAYTNRCVAKYHQDGTGLSAQPHPIEREVAYYIPEIIAKQQPGLWYKALLYENLEMEILWWQQHKDINNVEFYRQMQQQYFGLGYRLLHWLRQKMLSHGWI